MALQADKIHCLPRQHTRVLRAVQVVAGRTAFKAHGSVFERERTALVSVAIEAARLIGSENLCPRTRERSVRIVTIHA